MGLMRKSVGVLAAMVLASAGTCLAADKVENPEYKQWSQFKAGTTATIKSEMSGTTNERTVTLLEISPEKAVVETKMSMMVQGKPMDMPAQKRDVPAMMEKMESTASAPKMDTKDLGTEDVDVAGTKISCKVTETTMEVGGNKMTSKTWMSDKVPGGMVKMETAQMKSMMTALTIK